MRRIKFLVVLLGLFLSSPPLRAQDEVTGLCDALAGSDAAARVDACRKLAALGPRGAAAVPQLVGVLENTSSDAELRRCAMLALSTMGRGAEPAVPALTEILKADDPKLRAYAAHVLGTLGPAAQSAAPALVERALDKDPVVRREVRDALRQIGAPKELTRPLFLKMLKEASPEDASAAVLTLAELGEEVVPQLCEALSHKDAGYWACLALGEIGPAAAAAVPHLAPLLDSNEEEVRMQALLTLAKIGPAAKGLVPEIGKILDEDRFEGVRYAATFALGSIGEKEAAVAPVARALDAKDELLRVASAWAYLRLVDDTGPTTEKAVQNVIKGFDSTNSNVRDAAANALADPDISDADVREAFRKALEGIEDPESLERIADTIASQGPRVVPACIRSLEGQRKLRFYALRILIQLGPDSAPAVPALIMTLDDRDPVLRREAEYALGAIGPAAAKATEKLAAKLSDEDQDVRHTACYALGKIGPDARGALPALQKAMQSTDEFLALASTWASLKIAPDNAELRAAALPVLIKALNDKREHVRTEAVYLLGEFDDPKAIEAVKSIQHDTSPAVRAAVAEVLEARNK